MKLFFRFAGQVVGDASARLKRRVLTHREVEGIRDTTPTLAQGSARLFRDLRDKGAFGKGCLSLAMCCHVGRFRDYFVHGVSVLAVDFD